MKGGFTMPIALAEGAGALVTVDWASIFGSVDFSQLITGWTGMIPYILPILVCSYGIKAAWRFARKSLRSASK